MRTDTNCSPYPPPPWVSPPRGHLLFFLDVSSSLVLLFIFLRGFPFLPRLLLLDVSRSSFLLLLLIPRFPTSRRCRAHHLCPFRLLLDVSLSSPSASQTEKCVHTQRRGCHGCNMPKHELVSSAEGQIHIKYNAARKARGGAREMLTQTAGRWHFKDFKT